MPDPVDNTTTTASLLSDDRSTNDRPATSVTSDNHCTTPPALTTSLNHEPAAAIATTSPTNVQLTPTRHGAPQTLELVRRSTRPNKGTPPNRFIDQVQ